jgi:hypothetical protein
MNKGILLAIKIIVSIFAFGFIGLAKKIGIPIIAANIIGFGVVYAIWKYNPNEPNNKSDNQQLNKS